MRGLVSGKALRRAIAGAIGLLVIGAVAAPSVSPARGQGATSVAVDEFQNEGGAPAGIAPALSQALYKAVSSSGAYEATGGGPLPLSPNLTNDSFVDALTAAAKAGAEDVLIGSIVQVSGGQVFYRLSLYRVAPVTFIASQVFSQTYPPADANALSAGFATNVATLSAPRQSVGTIYSTDNGVRSDTGSSDGFMLGDRFNVMRGGQKVAEAQITGIRNDDADLAIGNPSSGYSAHVGDTLVGLRALAPALPAPPTKSTFNPLGFLAAVGGVLLAIGHHGQPGGPGFVTGSPQPSSSPFTVTSPGYSGSPPNVTFTFIFSSILSNTSLTSIPANLSYAYFTTIPPGSSATTPPQAIDGLGPPPTFQTITGSGGQQESQMTINAQGLVSGEVVTIFFLSAITDLAGAQLQATSFQTNPLSLYRHPFGIRPHHVVVPPGPALPGNPVPPHPLPKPPKTPPQ